MAIDTRVTAAGRLRVIAPEAARKLLEGAFVLLRQNPGGEPDYFTYRLLSAYAAIDLDAAERAFAAVNDPVFAYTALIDQAARQQDFSRAIRLTRQALRAGRYSLGAITYLLQVLAAGDPPRAAALQEELVRAFPARKASLAEVRALLTYVAQNPPIDPARGRRAARLAFQALRRPGIREAPSAGEYTATYVLGGQKFVTGTTYETVLLPAAAFLAVFDAREYRRRGAALPAWKTGLSALSAADLPELMKTQRIRRLPPQPRPPGAPPPPPRDLHKMTFDELLAFAAPLAPEDRLSPLFQAGRLPGIAPEQQERAYPLALDAASRIPSGAMRYTMTGRVFDLILENRLDALIPAAIPVWLAALDAGVRSDDLRTLGDHQRGTFGRRYAALARLLDERGIQLPEPHPAIEAQRVLRGIEALRLPARDFSLPSQDGSVVRLSDLRGKVVVLDFWATWCEPCRKALPVVSRLHREWSSKGVVVLGIDDEPASVVRAFAARHGLGYPTLIDRGRRIHNLFGVEGIPAAIVIGRDGALVERVPFPHNDENFRAALRKAGVE